MNVKIDTKEKFTVITPIDPDLSANMTEKLQELLLDQQKKLVPHVILDLKNIMNITDANATCIAEVQQVFYKNENSFVVCCLGDAVKKIFEKEDLLDFLNYTPTESEAWDILQMEEIERELLGDE